MNLKQNELLGTFGKFCSTRLQQFVTRPFVTVDIFFLLAPKPGSTDFVSPVYDGRDNNKSSRRFKFNSGHLIYPLQR